MLREEVLELETFFVVQLLFELSAPGFGDDKDRL
jgi:hypothetical protein